MLKLDRWQKNWLILLVYAALTAGLTYPMLWNLTRGAYGQTGRDVLQYVWQLWWAKHALLTLQQLPSNVTVMGWPEGIYHPLLFVTPYLDLLGLPITLLTGSSTTYNVHVLLSFTLSGFTAYLLAYNLTRNRLAGFVGGVVFAFAAQRWAHAFTGHLYHITIYWGPLFVWAMGRFMRAPGKKWGLWVGFTAGFVALTHVMHAAYWLLPVAIVLFIWGWRTFAATTPGWWNGIIKGGLWGLLPLGLIAGPFYGYFFITLNQTEGDLEAGGIVGNATDLLAYLTPTPGNPLLNSLQLIPESVWQFLPPVDLDENVAYVGLAASALAAVGIFGTRKQEKGPWIWLALITAVLALGPFLKVGGNLVAVNVGETSSYIPMPYSVLAKIPPLSWGRTTGRLNQTLMIAMSVLNAYGVAYLLRRFGPRPILKAGIFFTVAFFIAESLVVAPFPRATPKVSPYYFQAQAASIEDAAGVLDLPLRNKLAVNRAMFSQTFLRRPIMGGYIHRRFRRVEYGQHFADLLFRPATDIPAFQSPTDAERLAALRALNISTVILHKDMVDRELDKIQEVFVEKLLGRPLYEDELIRVFQVPQSKPLQAPITFARASNWTDDGLFPESNSPRHVYIYVPQPTYIYWSLTVTPIVGPTIMSIDTNDLPTQRILVARPQQFETLPMAVEPGIYRINLVNDNICGGQSGCFPLRFDQVELRQATAISPPAAVWGEDNIRLMRYSLSIDPNTGQPLLVLDWLPLKSPGFEPTVFAHILDAGDNRIGQVDRRILDGQYPSSAWEAGILVRDVIPLPFSAGNPWREYKLKLGLYNSAAGVRMPITAPQTGDNSIQISFVEAAGLSLLQEP